MEEKYILNGYEFETEKEYQTALEEKVAIDRLMQKVNLKNKDMLIALYSGLITEEKFSTAVGLEYLRKLRSTIIKQGYASDAELLPIPFNQFKPNRADSFKLTEAEKKIEEVKNAGKRDKEMVKTLFIVNAILIIVIGIMVYIASTSDNINILNYEREIKDKYSYWEKSLNEREQAVSEQEKQIEELKKQLGME